MSLLRFALAACFCAVFLLCSPAFAQTELPLSSNNKIPYGPSAAAPLRVQNDIVAVQVNTANDTVSGEIRYAGLFNIGTANDLPLLHEFPKPPISSHVNIRVDGQTYSNDPQRTAASLLTLLATPVLSDSTIVCVYHAGAIEVRQRLTPKKFSRTTGAILIEYEMVNRDPSNAHQVGVLLEMDTFINGNDDAPVLTSFGYSRNEQQFDAPALPDFFQAFQVNLVNPGLIAQGTLVGLNAVRPDRLVIGDWSRLSRVQWDYAVPNNTPYGDSGVLLRWNEKTLLPNEVRTVATYYGRGDVTTQPGLLTLHLTALRNLQANNGQLSPNPFDVNLLVYNNGAIPANAVQATLRLPVGLALVSGEFATKLLAPSNLNAGANGTVTWKVLAQCPLADTDLNMTVEVSGTPSLSNAVTRAIFLPSCATSLPNFKITAQPDSTVITAGETASFQINMAALNGFTQPAQLSFWPPTVGVTGNFSSALIQPNGAVSFNLQTNRNLLAGEYPFIITGTGSGLARSDSVKVRVRAAAPLDNVAPVLSNPFPANGATSVPLDTKISVEVYDPAPSAGLDLNSVRMLVNGAAVVVDRTSLGTGYVFTHQPTNPFRLNETVRVSVVASDLATPPKSNSIAFEFTTTRDLTPPFVVDLNPARNARNVLLQTSIAAIVRDEIAGVDSSTIKMLVNAQSIPITITRENKDFLVQTKELLSFRDGERVAVEIQAQDLATPKNILTEKYEFTTVRDTLAPFVFDLQPGPNAVNVAREVEIRGRFQDDLTGVDSAAIRLEINGRAETPALRREGKDFVFAFKPLVPFALNEEINVRLIYADQARVPNRATKEYSFAIVQDRQPPFVTSLSPARSASNVSPKMAITFEVRDALAGVDSASIKLSVNGKQVARVLTGNAAAYGVSFKPDEVLLAGSDTVHVQIVAADLASPPNSMPPDIYYYTLSRDRVPPFTSGHNPPRLSRNASLDAQITLEILDLNPGVDTSSIRLFVNGSAAELQLEQVPNGYRVRQKSKPRWRDNQTVTVKVQAQDLAALPNAMPEEEYTFTTVRDSLAPTARDFAPRPGEINVAPNTTISFVVEDDLTGVDRTALVLLVNGNAVQPSLQPLANGFVVRYDLSPSNLPSDTVWVEVRARDRATQPNVNRETYYFVTSQDRTPPLLSDFFPPNNTREVPVNAVITFQVRDEISGVDSASVRLFVNGESKPITLSGERRLYQASYQPAINFSLAQRIEVAVEARDRAMPPNEMPRRVFQFTTVEPLPDLIAAELIPLGNFELKKATKVRATLRREGLAVRENFRIELKADLNVVKDTTIAANTFGTTLQLEASAQFDQGGQHSIEVLIDADDKIKETNETNNRLQIVTQILQTLSNQLTVRPNPFTPNGDAINDDVEFDFSGLTLTNPTLHIFDVNGIAVFLTDRSAGKRFTWNGRDERGKEVQPGVYLYTVRDLGANVKSGYVVVAR